MRGWTDTDRPGMHAVNSDPAVMATLGPVMSRPGSDAFVDRVIAHWAERGFGLWCIELDGACIGFTGLAVPRFEAPFIAAIEATGQPCVEVGWRLASAHWGRGYAPEAAKAALRFAFDEVGLEQVVSFTAASNHKSRRVMDKLGLHHDPSDDFEHPNVPDGSPLRPHVVYRITATGADALPWRRG